MKKKKYVYIVYENFIGIDLDIETALHFCYFFSSLELVNLFVKSLDNIKNLTIKKVEL